MIRGDVVGYNGNPPLWHIASGIARQVVDLGGAAMPVHVQRDCTRRVHVIHAPAPAMNCRDVAAVVASRNLPARACVHDSPPLSMIHGRAMMLVYLLVFLVTCDEYPRSLLKKD